MCVLCKLISVNPRGSMCATCNPSPSNKSRFGEGRMASQLLEWFEQGAIPKFTLWNKQNPLADPVQNGRFRPDFSFVSADGVVLLEYDERMHETYSKRCELVRMAEVGIGYHGRPVHWVRYNPDAFKVTGATRRTDKKERHAVLKKVLEDALGLPDYENLIKIEYVCYDKPQADPSAESDLVQTLKFRDYEAYCTWVDEVAPAPAPGPA